MKSKIAKKTNEATEAQQRSRFELLPEWTAVHAVTHCKYNGTLPEGVAIDDLLKTVLAQGREINSEQTDQIERQLYAQGVALSLMFDKLMRMMGMSETLKQMEALGHLALKAQSQSRATFVALNTLNNPNRTTFIRQQNNAVNQQINDSSFGPTANELLTERPNETLDFGTKTGAVTQNTIVEAMAEVYRPENDRG